MYVLNGTIKEKHILLCWNSFQNSLKTQWQHQQDKQLFQPLTGWILFPSLPDSEKLLIPSHNCSRKDMSLSISLHSPAVTHTQIPHCPPKYTWSLGSVKILLEQQNFPGSKSRFNASIFQREHLPYEFQKKFKLWLANHNFNSNVQLNLNLNVQFKHRTIIRADGLPHLKKLCNMKSPVLKR